MKGYVFGSNLGSQLAQPPSFDDSPTPVPIPFFDNKTVQQVSCGVMHTIALVNNKVYTWGCNDEGALGRDTDETIVDEVKILSGIRGRPFLDKKMVKGESMKIVSVSGGASHSAALSHNGNVYAWGTFRDISGVIGFKKGTRIQKTPILINKNVVKIVSTDNVIVMLNKNGGVQFYGAEMYRDRSNFKRKAEQKYPPGLRSGKRGSRKEEKPIDLGAGGNHCFLIYESGKVTVFGNNNCAQYGTGNKESSTIPQKVCLENVIKATGGFTHSLFLTKNGDVYGTGESKYGQVGTETQEELKPVKIMEQCEDICSRGSMNLAIKSDGVYSWGANFYGELGHLGSEINRIPKRIEYDFGEVCFVGCGTNHSVVISKK